MKNMFETIVQFVFILFAFIIVLLVSLGISLDFSRVGTATYWVEVSLQLAMTMCVFNITYYIDRKNKMHNVDSRFYRAYASNRLKIKYLENEKLYNELDLAVEEENLERLKKKCNQKLYKICTRISYDEVITDKPLEDIAKEFRVNPKRIKKFMKLANKIRSGNIKIKKIKPNVFLQDKELCSTNFDNYDFSTVANEVERNGEKALTFLLYSMISAIIVYSFTTVNFWSTLITNITLLLGAIVSGFISSSKNIKLKTQIYEKRNSFLFKKLNITIEYDPTTHKEKTPK